MGMRRMYRLKMVMSDNLKNMVQVAGRYEILKMYTKMLEDYAVVVCRIKKT